MIGLALGLVLLQAAASPAPQPLDVCKFVDQVRSLQKHIVQVRGVVNTLADKDDVSLDDLVVDSCPSRAGKPVRVSIQWPDQDFLAHPPEGYKVDAESFRRAAEIVTQAQAQGKPVDQIIATIEGVAYAPEKAAPPEEWDFGHHGHVDALIIIQAVRDVKILDEMSKRK